MAGTRPVFYVSDGTGITAETIGHSLLTQFIGVDFDTRRIAFVDSLEKAHALCEQVEREICQHYPRAEVLVHADPVSAVPADLGGNTA